MSVVENNRTVVLLSGGLDSTVLLFDRIELLGPENVFALSIDYGQKHSKELSSAQQIAACAELEPEVGHYVVEVDFALRSIFAQAKSSQVSRNNVPVPEGHYASDNMRATIVPNRNMMLLSIAGVLAESINASNVAYAAHAGDHPIYPDCRPEFADAMDKALLCATDGRVFLTRPFIKKSKADIVRAGSDLGVPFGLTYSCYVGKKNHCGRCGTCVERKEAFRLAKVIDPTRYEDEDFGVQAYKRKEEA